MRTKRLRDGRIGWKLLGLVAILGCWGIGCAEVLAADEAAETTASPAGRVYFISLTGTAEGTGAKDQPFATYAQARAVLRAGDTLYYREGVYAGGSYAPPLTAKAAWGW